MGKIEVKKCVGEIIDTLCDRGGFDDWWYNLDDEVELTEDELEGVTGGTGADNFFTLLIELC